MTPGEINKRIAEWAGLDSHVCDEWAFHCDDCERGSIQTPYYYRSNAAMDLLGVLVERGYSPCLYWCIGNKWSIELYFDGDYVLGVSKETIPAAICHAIIELIEKEGK